MLTLLIDAMTKISIIIPVYKVEQYIESCLCSVINQNFKGGELECIIVNDCTPDKSMEIVYRILASYEGAIQFKVIHHKVNKGLSAARNSGVKLATGEYVYFLDSDDILAKQAIGSMSPLCEEGKPDVVIGDFEETGICNKIDESNISASNSIDQEYIFNSFISGNLYEMAWNKLVKKEFFLRYNLWFREGIIHEDTLWSFFLFYYCTSLKICSEKTYKYRIRDNSIMTDSQNALKSFWSCYDIFFIEIDFIKKNFLFQKYPLLISYMVNRKFALQKKIVELKIGSMNYSNVKRELGKRYGFKRGITYFSRIKILLSNLPFGLFKSLMLIDK